MTAPMASRDRTETTLRGVARESAVIPVRGAHLLIRNFPQLVTVICLGLAGRQAVIWLAVWLSAYSSFAASLVMPLAPVCVMLAIIFCLWLLRPSLPFLAATFPERGETSPKVRLLSAGGMLISFLTVYSTHGMLKEDLASFRHAATITEFQNQGVDADFSRAFVDSIPALIGLIGGTILLRKIIGYFALAEKGLGLTYLSAYLEVLWMTTVSVFLTNQISALQDWALSRQSVAPAYRGYKSLKTEAETALGDSAGVIADAWTWLADTLPAFNQLVTIPIAWLTLGAVVFGTSLAAKKAADGEDKQEEQPEGEAPRRRMSAQLKAAAEAEAKRTVDEALQPVAGPLKTLWNALKTLARAGLVPMTIFCLVFMSAVAVEIGAVELGRAIAGPQTDILLSEVAAQYILVGARACYLLVVVCLIASGLDFFLRHTYSPDADGDDKKLAGSGSTKVT